MKVFEAVNAAVAAEGADHVFAVMGDANQNMIVGLCEKHKLKFVHALGLATTEKGPVVVNVRINRNVELPVR